MNPILNQIAQAAWGTPGGRRPGPTPPPPSPVVSPGLAGMMPHAKQRLNQMQAVAPLLGPGFELLLERQGMTNPAATFQAMSQAFAKHAQQRGTNPRAMLMQLLAKKRQLGLRA